MEVTNTSGRRKTSVARAYITKGKGSIEVNGKDYKRIFLYTNITLLRNSSFSYF